ncbi:bcl-2-like protein 2 [Tubulanus polymorphus]|uniref:bcl-2-like protein 2 n=1 Tax=Tubulanus polymorphus TaxID=672921 RepID=UPI003DA38DA0
MNEISNIRYVALDVLKNGLMGSSTTCAPFSATHTPCNHGSSSPALNNNKKSMPNGYTKTETNPGYSKLNGYNNIGATSGCKTVLGGVEHQSTQTTEEPLSKDDFVARELAMDIVHYVSGIPPKSGGTGRHSKYAKTLRRTVEEITRRHDILFVNMIDRFQINTETGEESFTAIADEMLSDGQVNWGRIVTVYALGAHFARYSAENGMPQYVGEIGHFLGEYANRKLLRWISENGGWEAFYEFFPDKSSVEDKIWNGLWVAVAGLGALAALAAAR